MISLFFPFILDKLNIEISHIPCLLVGYRCFYCPMRGALGRFFPTPLYLSFPLIISFFPTHYIFLSLPLYLSFPPIIIFFPSHYKFLSHSIISFFPTHYIFLSHPLYPYFPHIISLFPTYLIFLILKVEINNYAFIKNIINTILNLLKKILIYKFNLKIG